MLQNLGKIHGILILNHNHVLIHLQEVELLQYAGVGRQSDNQEVDRQKLVGKKTALEIFVPILKGKEEEAASFSGLRAFGPSVNILPHSPFHNVFLDPLCS